MPDPHTPIAKIPDRVSRRRQAKLNTAMQINSHVPALNNGVG